PSVRSARATSRSRPRCSRRRVHASTTTRRSRCACGRAGRRSARGLLPASSRSCSSRASGARSAADARRTVPPARTSRRRSVAPPRQSPPPRPPPRTPRRWRRPRRDRARVLPRGAGRSSVSAAAPVGRDTAGHTPDPGSSRLTQENTVTAAAEPAPGPDEGPAASAPPARSLGRTSIVMAAGTAASRLGGLVRNMMLVAAIGSVGSVAVTFDVANKLPNVMFAILAGGALNAVLVPQIVKAFRAHNAQERIDKLLTVSALGILVLTTVLTAAASWVVLAYTHGLSAEELALGTIFAYWCIPQLFFYGLYTLLGQVLNAREQFGPFMWAPVATNVVSVIGFGVLLLVFGGAPDLGINDLDGWDTPRTVVLAGTATLGIVAQALVLLVPLLRSGFRWHLRLGLRGIGLRSAGSVAVWSLAAVVLEQAGILYLTRVA